MIIIFFFICSFIMFSVFYHRLTKVSYLGLDDFSVYYI